LFLHYGWPARAGTRNGGLTLVPSLRIIDIS